MSPRHEEAKAIVGVLRNSLGRHAPITASDLRTLEWLLQMQAELLEAVEKAADTFRDTAQFLDLAQHPKAAESLRIAETFMRELLQRVTGQTSTPE